MKNNTGSSPLKILALAIVLLVISSCNNAGIIVPESYSFGLKWGTYWDHSIRRNISFVSQLDKLYLHNCNDKDSILSTEEFTITREQSDSLFILTVLNHRNFDIEHEHAPILDGATIEISLRVGDKSITDRYLSCSSYDQSAELTKMYGIIRRITGKPELFR